MRLEGRTDKEGEEGEKGEEVKGKPDRLLPCVFHLLPLHYFC